MESGHRRAPRRGLRRAVAIMLASSVCGCVVLGYQAATAAPAAALVLDKVGNFAAPVHVDAMPRFPRLLFVVEKPGRIAVLRDGKKLARPFLDIRGRVDDLGERGLLSIAFPANYKKSRRFYVFYTRRNGDNRVEEFKRSRKIPPVRWPRPAAGYWTFHTRRPPTDNGDSSSSGPTAISTSRRATGAATPMPPPTATCCWGSSCGSIPASGAVARYTVPSRRPRCGASRPQRDRQLRPAKPLAVLV